MPGPRRSVLVLLVAVTAALVLPTLAQVMGFEVWFPPASKWQPPALPSGVGRVATDRRGRSEAFWKVWPRAGSSSGVSVIEHTEDRAHPDRVLGVVWFR